MPLNQQHQLSILQDILKNQQLDCCGTVAECQQMQRLIQSLLGYSQNTPEIEDTLLAVYSYSQHGKNAKNLEQHISAHKDDLSIWINSISDYNLT